MSQNKNLLEVTNHKEDALARLSGLLDKMISSSDPLLQKKADKISYWIETYTGYLDREKDFDPKKNISYSRGDVIRANFGFRIGSEIGGLHFAVVIEKNNSHSANVLTVIPLSSTDGKKVHPANVDLGYELYSKLEAKQKSLLDEANKKLENIQDEINTLKVLTPTDLSSSDQIASYAKLHHEWSEKERTTNLLIQQIKRNSKEISKMKKGSMAVMNQITTISKQRIYTPKKSEDFLYGITLSTNALEKINKKLQEKLVF